MTSLPRIKVLINGLHAKSGGGVTYLRNILPHFADDARISWHLLLSESQLKLFPEIDPRITLHAPETPSGMKGLLIWEQLRLPRLAKEWEIDVTFSPANYGPLFAPKPVILLRNALAVGEEDKRWDKRLYWAVLSAVTWASIKTAKEVIAVSAYTRDAVAKTEAKRVKIIHHGVSQDFSPAPPVNAGPPFLLAVGDLYIQKNLHNLIEALARLKGDFPDLRLKLAGKPIDADYAARLKESVARLGLSADVEFLDGVNSETLRQLYRDCAVFVFPSTVETFGNPLVEAMASGAVIASSNRAAMPEILGEAGLYFNPEDSAEIAEKISRLLNDEQLRGDLKAKALARAKDFSWAKTAKLTADLLLKL
jgi:glycosyltransferase involved in cell wall biosynthesis